jgi:group I intron endonuclease
LSNDRHHSRHFQRTWNKYGSAEFVWEVLEECSLDRLTEREQWHMDHQDKLFNSAPAAGSMLGFKHSEATRLKASAARKGYKHSPESRAKISAGNKGKQVSAEAKAKISAANKGRVKSPASSQPPPPDEYTRQRRERREVNH